MALWGPKAVIGIRVRYALAAIISNPAQTTHVEPKPCSGLSLTNSSAPSETVPLIPNCRIVRSGLSRFFSPYGPPRRAHNNGFSVFCGLVLYGPRAIIMLPCSPPRAFTNPQSSLVLATRQRNRRVVAHSRHPWLGLGRNCIWTSSRLRRSWPILTKT